jgi:hypothetical protein
MAGIAPDRHGQAAGKTRPKRPRARYARDLAPDRVPVPDTSFLCAPAQTGPRAAGLINAAGLISCAPAERVVR